MLGLGGSKHESKCSSCPVTAGVQREGKHVGSRKNAYNSSVAAQKVGFLLRCVPWNIILVTEFCFGTVKPPLDHAVSFFSVQFSHQIIESPITFPRLQ